MTCLKSEHEPIHVSCLSGLVRAIYLFLSLFALCCLVLLNVEVVAHCALVLVCWLLSCSRRGLTCVRVWVGGSCRLMSILLVIVIVVV